MKATKIISQAGAAEWLDRSPRHIWRLVEEGVLEEVVAVCGRRIGVTLASVRQYKQKRRPAGRPREAK